MTEDFRFGPVLLLAFESTLCPISIKHAVNMAGRPIRRTWNHWHLHPACNGLSYKHSVRNHVIM